MVLGRFGCVDDVLKRYNGKSTGVVQQFVDNPMLTSDGKKMDFRYYILVTSLDSETPTAYVNEHGYVRVAGERYQKNADISKQVLNSKKSASTRWSLKDFWEKLMTHVDVDRVKNNVLDLLRRIVCNLKVHLGCNSKSYPYTCSSATQETGVRFQLMGIDVGLDAEGNAILFEMGFDPSLKRRTGPSAKAINANDDRMYRDLFSLVLASKGKSSGSLQFRRLATRHFSNSLAHKLAWTEMLSPQTKNSTIIKIYM